MADVMIQDDLLALLRRVGTPTVCNAVEVAQGQRGFNQVTHGTMLHSGPGTPPSTRVSGLPELSQTV